MNVVVLEFLSVNAYFFGVKFNVSQSDFRAFLHHFAEFAGEIKVALSLEKSNFYGERRSADLRPGKPRRAAHFVVSQFVRIGESVRAEIFFNRFIVDIKFLFRLSARHFRCDFSAYRAYLPFEISHARFTRKPVYKSINGAFFKLNAFNVKPVFNRFFRHEITLCDLVFFVSRVTAQFQNLHSVEKGRWDGFERVCRGDENNLGQIVRYFEITVAESDVLFGV